MEKIIVKWVCLILVLLGLFIIFKPNYVIEQVKKFYSNYPIIKYAGLKELTSRKVFIIIVGFIFIIIGVVYLFK